MEKPFYLMIIKTIFEYMLKNKQNYTYLNGFLFYKRVKSVSFSSEQEQEQVLNWGDLPQLSSHYIMSDAALFSQVISWNQMLQNTHTPTQITNDNLQVMQRNVMIKIKMLISILYQILKITDTHTRTHILRYIPSFPARHILKFHNTFLLYKLRVFLKFVHLFGKI